MANLLDYPDNAEFENFLIKNFENIKKQGSAFIETLEKMAQLIDDNDILELIEKLKCN